MILSPLTYAHTHMRARTHRTNLVSCTHLIRAARRSLLWPVSHHYNGNEKCPRKKSESENDEEMVLSDKPV